MDKRQKNRPPVSATRSTAAVVDASVIDAGEIAKTLGADLENGLSAAEASRRLAESGPNELRSAPQTPVWRRVLSHFQDPLVC